jgi:hypothetical protein
MSSRLPVSLAAVVILLVAGCNTTFPTTSPTAEKPAATVPTMGPVTPPPAPVDVRPATIKGSEESSTLLDNFTAFVRSVDGQPVSAGRKGWNQALELKAGSHRLTVEFIRGSFYARTELLLDAKAGAAYELHQNNDAQVYGQHSYCEFWVTDAATGQKVAASKRVGLDKVKTGN